ncbi:hypothetical protein [Nitrosomonas communis]|uniref:hypothetical protein n=1 Tax=Nitrosomonas communis TaxID=44574 RepID=UPI003D2E7777
MDISGIALSVRPDLPYGAIVYSADRSGGVGSITCPRFSGGWPTIAQHDGGGAEPKWLLPTQGSQGQTPKKRPEMNAIFANIADKGGKPIMDPAVWKLGRPCA